MSADAVDLSVDGAAEPEVDAAPEEAAEEATEEAMAEPTEAEAAPATAPAEDLTDADATPAAAGPTVSLPEEPEGADGGAASSPPAATTSPKPTKKPVARADSMSGLSPQMRRLVRRGMSSSAEPKTRRDLSPEQQDEARAKREQRRRVQELWSKHPHGCARDADI
jgi:hypothetical protein